MTVCMKLTAFWESVPCNLVEEYRRFGGAYYLHLQGHEPENEGPESCHFNLVQS
jgi:hypothetical protein